MSDENEELQTWIDPELEARVVALVLGEASAFEAAELERIIAEKPELGIFKRRIEAVHGLVQAASRQETDPMRMDAARRARLLEKLGQKESASAPAAVVAMPQAPAGRGRIILRIAVGIAACLVLAGLILSISGTAQKKAALNSQLVAEAAEEARIEQLKADESQAAGGEQSYGMSSARTVILAKPVTAPPERLAALDNLKALAGEMKDKEDEPAFPPGGNAVAGANFHGTFISGPRDVNSTQAPVAQTAPLDTGEHDWNPDASSRFAQHISLGNSPQGLTSGNAAMLQQAAAQAEQQMANANVSGNVAQSQASAAAAPVQEAREELAQAQDSLQSAKNEKDAAAPAGAPQAAKEAQAAQAQQPLADEEKAGSVAMIEDLKKAAPAEAQAEAAASKSMAEDRPMAASQNLAEASAQAQASAAAAPAQEPQLAQAQAALQTADDEQEAAAAPGVSQYAIRRAKAADQPKAAEDAARSEDNKSEAHASSYAYAARAAGGATGGGVAMQAQESARQLGHEAIDRDGNTAAAQPQLQQAQQQLDELSAPAAAPMNAPAAAPEELPPTGEAVESRISGGNKARQLKETDYYNPDAAAKVSGGNTFTGATTVNGGALAMGSAGTDIAATGNPVTFTAGATTATAPSAPALSIGGGAAQVQQQAAAAQMAQADQPAAAASAVANGAAGTGGAAPAVMDSGGLVTFAGGGEKFKATFNEGSQQSTAQVDLSQNGALGSTQAAPFISDVSKHLSFYASAGSNTSRAQNEDEAQTTAAASGLRSGAVGSPVAAPAIANSVDIVSFAGAVHHSQAQITHGSPINATQSPALGDIPVAGRAFADKQAAPTIVNSQGELAFTGGITTSHPVNGQINYGSPIQAPAGASAQTFAFNTPKRDVTVLNGDVPVVGRLEITEGSGRAEELLTKEYKVPSSFFAPPPHSDARALSAAATQFLMNQGLTFPPGATAEYNQFNGSLIVRDTKANLEVLENTVEASIAPPSQQGDEVSAADQPYSTFSLHVSDVSFLLARNALAHGQMPDPEAIRPEEFYNAFDYCDPAPAAGQKIACKIEQAAHPMLQQRNLVRIAMKVAATGRGAGQPLRLTVLLDTSGSMEREDRAASIRRAMQALTSLLGPNDSVTLIGFARQPRLLAEAVPGDQAGKLVDIVKRTPAEGGTNMEEAIKAASELARRHLLAGAQNRVVMLTDGAANLGDADPEQLGKLVEKLRQQGISFDACGVGANGFDDEILEALTRKGGGRYYFLNAPGDADDGFARELAGAFRPAAEDVKMQVRFNPTRVGNYRLIGFEKHRLKQEDFRNDKVTAAQLAAEEAAVALYQVQVLPEGEGEIGEVFVRFRDPTTGAIVEQSWTIPYDAGAPALDKAPPSMQLATTSSLVAEKLRGGAIADAIDLDSLAPIVAQLRGEYPQQSRVHDMVTMFEQTRRMTQRR